jgi:hypothetical protein
MKYTLSCPAARTARPFVAASAPITIVARIQRRQLIGTDSSRLWTDTSATQDIKQAGKETKKASQEASDAAKDAGKATGKATKKTAKKEKHAVTPNMTTATCKDGTVQKGHTKTTACNGHGGVK